MDSFILGVQPSPRKW